MKKMVNSFKSLMKNEKGASNVEIIVWISVVLVIATILFLFRDAITTFITNATGEIGDFSTN